MNYDSLITIRVLENELTVLKSKIMPEDCGHIFTTISVIKDRIQEIEQMLTSEEQTWYALNKNI
tara:strand:- start:1435 stop:1626 length:192 start_codon:yes stop_codon:yes gene_type:complete